MCFMMGSKGWAWVDHSGGKGMGWAQVAGSGEGWHPPPTCLSSTHLPSCQENLLRGRGRAKGGWRRADPHRVHGVGVVGVRACEKTV